MSTVPGANPDVVLTELPDGSGVLLDLRTKFYFTLNRTGVAVWKLLEADPGLTAAQLGERIARQFDGAAVDAVQRDVEEHLRELAREGLLPQRASAP